jgi:hypothetical protein
MDALRSFPGKRCVICAASSGAPLSPIVATRYRQGEMPEDDERPPPDPLRIADEVLKLPHIPPPPEERTREPLRRTPVGKSKPKPGTSDTPPHER